MSIPGNVGVSKTDIYGPSHQDMQTMQVNMLKNQAVKLGANVISITNHQTKYFHHSEYIISEAKVQSELDVHAMSGKAYRCSPGLLNQLTQKNPSNISDVRLTDE